MKRSRAELKRVCRQIWMWRCCLRPSRPDMPFGNLVWTIHSRYTLQQLPWCLNEKFSRKQAEDALNFILFINLMVEVEAEIINDLDCESQSTKMTPDITACAFYLNSVELGGSLCVAHHHCGHLWTAPMRHACLTTSIGPLGSLWPSPQTLPRVPGHLRLTSFMDRLVWDYVYTKKYEAPHILQW